MILWAGLCSVEKGTDHLDDDEWMISSSKEAQFTMVPPRSRPRRDHFQTLQTNESFSLSTGHDIDFVAASCDRSLAHLVLRQVDEVVASRNRVKRRQAEAFYTLDQRRPQHPIARPSRLEIPLNLQENAVYSKPTWTAPLADDLSTECDSNSGASGIPGNKSDEEVEMQDEDNEKADDLIDDFDSACDDTAIAVAFHNWQQLKQNEIVGADRLPARSSEITQSAQACYQSLLQIQENATLKQRKLELEVNYLRKALDDAKAACQKLLMQDRQSSDTHAKASEKKIIATNATVEEILKDRLRMSDENFAIKEMVLKHSCENCRTEFKSLLRNAGALSNQGLAIPDVMCTMRPALKSMSATMNTTTTEDHSISASLPSRLPPTYHQAAQKLVQKITEEALGSSVIEDELADGERDDYLSTDDDTALSVLPETVQSPSVETKSIDDAIPQGDPACIKFDEYRDSSFVESSSSPSSSFEASVFACESNHFPDSLLSHPDNSFSESSAEGANDMPNGKNQHSTPKKFCNAADTTQSEAEYSVSASTRIDPDLDTTIIRRNTSKPATDTSSGKTDSGPSLAAFLTQDCRKSAIPTSKHFRTSQSVSLQSTSLSTATSKRNSAHISNDDITVHNDFEASEERKNSKVISLSSNQIDVAEVEERKDLCNDNSGLLVKIERQSPTVDRTRKLNHRIEPKPPNSHDRSFQRSFLDKQDLLAEKHKAISTSSPMLATAAAQGSSLEGSDELLGHSQQLQSNSSPKNDLYNNALVAAMENGKRKGPSQRNAVASADTFLADINQSIHARPATGSLTDESAYGDAIVAAMSQDLGKGRKSWKTPAFKSWK